MSVPKHAAVATTVDLARAASGHRPAGFVNAVMRRITEQDLDGWISLLSPAAAPGRELSLRYSHPSWLVDEFKLALSEWDETEAFLDSTMFRHR